MMSDDYVDEVIRAVEDSSIKDQSLKDDLVDHLCCLIELQMKKGSAFENAKAYALEQTAPNGLDEIQQETIFLLNYSKTIFMKRLTYTLGFIFSAAFVMGIFFKLMHLPFAMILLFGGGTGLAFIFLPLMLINRYQQLMREVLSERLKWIMGSASFMLFILASLMKLNHLMGAAVMLGVSFLVFTVGFLPFLFFRMYRRSVEEV
ncbi:MAG: hypothetical protein RIC03_00250 [Cyclobacteriaceae bacterium]